MLRRIAARATALPSAAPPPQTTARTKAADPVPRAQPESVGFSPERLARIGEVLNADIEHGRLPGMVVAIARKGRLAYYESFGFLDKQAGTPMPKDAIFAIASMTKPMVGVGIMQLVEDTRIQMSDPASASGPTGNRYGDAPGHACIAIAGPVERAITLETQQGDREKNMRAFAKAALELLETSLR